MFRAAAAAFRGLAASNAASASTWTFPVLSRSLHGVEALQSRQNAATMMGSMRLSTSTPTTSFASSSAAAAATATRLASPFFAAAAAPSHSSSLFACSGTAAAAAGATAAAATTAAARRAAISPGPFFTLSSPFRRRSNLDFPRRESVLRRLFGGGGGRRPADSGDAVLFSLIGVNVGIYALWHVDPAFARRHFVVSAAALSEGRIHTLVTSAFSHRDGMSHLLVNMVSLFFFGRSVGGALGGRALLSLYLAAGAGGALAHCAAAAWPCRSLPASYRSACVKRSPGALGASAAVNGVVALSCLAWPASTVLLWGIVPVPAALLGAAFVFQDVSGAWRDIDGGRYGRGGGGGGGGVAHAGHLGGAAVGALAWAALRRRMPRW